jgi:hypothetical protein
MSTTFTVYAAVASGSHQLPLFPTDAPVEALMIDTDAPVEWGLLPERHASTAVLGKDPALFADLPGE